MIEDSLQKEVKKLLITHNYDPSFVKWVKYYIDKYNPSKTEWLNRLLLLI